MKWEISDAAIKRIKKRIVVSLQSAAIGFDPWPVLLEALEPEDYAHNRLIAEELLRRWISKGEMKGLTSECFREVCLDRREVRTAANNLMNGIRQMGRLKL